MLIEILRFQLKTISKLSIKMLIAGIILLFVYVRLNLLSTFCFLLVKFPISFLPTSIC